MSMQCRFLLLALVLPWPVAAQVGGEGRTLAPEHREAPKIRPSRGQLDFALPDARSLLPPEGRLSSGLAITVKRFEIIGSTVFPAETLQAEAAPYLNRPIGSEELDALRLRLTRLYVDAGYINSGAVIPDQEIRAGSVTIRIVEGRLDRIEIGGAHGFREDYLNSRLLDAPDRPFRVNTLQERMQLLLQNPQIARVNAELAPGERLGSSVLRVNVSEAPRHTLGIALANDRAPNVGSERLELFGALRNPLGRADSWTFRLGKTRGVDDVTAIGVVPLTANDTTLELRYEQNVSQVTEAPFDVLDIDSRSRSLEIGVRHPLHRTLQQTLSIGTALASRASTTYLGGERFSFSPGVTDGQSRIAALRLSADWLDRGRDYVFSARGVLSHGLATLGATRNAGDLPDARFNALLLQLQWVQRLNDAGATWQLRGDVQAARDPLFALEKFAVGGVGSVRGFRENQLMRDNGWTAAAELRWPFARLGFPGLSTQPGDGQLAAALFADVGEAWDKGGRKEKLWSAGPGIRWDIAADSHAQLYWAAARRDIAREHNDLQDRGVHFRIVMQRQF